MHLCAWFPRIYVQEKLPYYYRYTQDQKLCARSKIMSLKSRVLMLSPYFNTLWDLAPIHMTHYGHTALCTVQKGHMFFMQVSLMRFGFCWSIFVSTSVNTTCLTDRLHKVDRVYVTDLAHRWNYITGILVRVLLKRHKILGCMISALSIILLIFMIWMMMLSQASYWNLWIIQKCLETMVINKTYTTI